MSEAFPSILEQYRHWHGDRALARLEGMVNIRSAKRLSDGIQLFARHVAEMGGDIESIAVALCSDAVGETEGGKAMFGLSDDARSLLEAYRRVRPALESWRTFDDVWRELDGAARHDARLLVLVFADILSRLEEVTRHPSSAERRGFTRRVEELFLPASRRLGMQETADALDDLCSRILRPSDYAAMGVKLVSFTESARPRVRSIEDHVRLLDREGDIESLHWHPPRIANLLRSPIPLGGDIAAPLVFHIHVGSVEQAYRCVLKLHRRWKPVQEEFRDDLTAPRPDRLQALSTEVFTEGGRVQFFIATDAMWRRNDFGVALLVAEGVRSLPIESFTAGGSPGGGGVDTVVREDQKILYDDRNRQHRVPVEATALDAALLLYPPSQTTFLSTVRIDGEAVSFSSVAREGGRVTIEVVGTVQVRTEWLAGLSTSTAAFVVQRALKRIRRDEKVALGRRILQRQCDILQSGVLVSALSAGRGQSVAAAMKAETFDDVLVAVAEGVYPPSDVYGVLMEGEGKGKRWIVEALLARLLHRVTLEASFLLEGRMEICPDPLSSVSGIAEHRGITIHRTMLTMNQEKQSFRLRFSCTAPDRNALFAFLLTLEQVIGFTSVRTLLSRGRKILFLSITSLTAFAWILPFLVPAALRDILPPNVTLPLSIVPPLCMQYVLFIYVRSYMARFRESTRLFLSGLGLNFLALVLFLLLITYVIAPEMQTSLLGVVVLFVLASMATTYKFLTTQGFFHPPAVEKPLTQEEWRGLLRRKIAGYAFRIAAVTIWGIQPLYLRYTPANDVDPFVRVFLMSAGILLISLLFLAARAGYSLVRRRRVSSVRIPANKQLLGIIVGAAIYTYLLNASLRLTTSTNFILFNNVSPVLALLTAALLWRSSIPYLRDTRHMLWVFLIFLMGSAGSVLLVYNSVRYPGVGSVAGDIFGIMAMVADTLYVVSQIRYMKVVPQASSPMINIYVFSALAAMTLPVLVYWYVAGSALMRLATIPVLFALGAGVLSGIGQIFNYETFRRIDGFIAFLMFNISILITVAVEVFFIGVFSPTWVLLLGGMTIIGSTILAEVINSHCERKGY